MVAEESVIENALQPQPGDPQNYCPPDDSAAEPSNGDTTTTPFDPHDVEDSKPSALRENAEVQGQAAPSDKGEALLEPPEPANTTDTMDTTTEEPSTSIVDDDAPSNGAPMLYDPASDPMMVSDEAPKESEEHVPPAAAPPPAKKRRTGTKRSSIRPWNDMLFELLKYRLMHGNIMVPFKSGGELGKWVANQRAQYMGLQKSMLKDSNSAFVKTKWLSSEGTERLTEERMKVLTSIGFVWDVVQADNDARWKKRYEELLHYKTVNGHCNVPQSTDLGKWVKMQRENKHEADLKKAGTTPHRKKPKPCLSQERIEKLEAIGFQWRVAKPAVGWDKRFQQLVDYKREHGDCNVPQSYPPDKPFGRWVMKQRCQHSLKLRGEKSQLTDERERKLNEIEFAWVAPGFSKKTVNMPDDDEDLLQHHGGMPTAGVHPEPDLHHHHHLHHQHHHHPDEFSTWNV